MIKKSKIVKFLTVCILSTLFSGCLKDPVIDYNATCDVYYSSILDGDTVKYALTMYAYSPYKIDTAKVTSPDATPKITFLTPDNSSGLSYSSFPSDENYSAIKPASGNYTFNVIFDNDQKFTTVNVLTNTALLPPVIDTVKFDSQDKRIFIDWDKVDSAGAYLVDLLDSDDEVVFESALLNPDFSSVQIGKTTSGWKANFVPAANMEFKIALKAFVLEPGFGNSNYNLQAVSVNKSKSIVWDAQ